MVHNFFTGFLKVIRHFIGTYNNMPALLHILKRRSIVCYIAQRNSQGKVR